MTLFLEFASQNPTLPLTKQSVAISADIYANLRRKGSPIDDIDILIAGVAIANDLVLTTRNEQHFGRIEGLEIENWSNPVKTRLKVWFNADSQFAQEKPLIAELMAKTLAGDRSSVSGFSDLGLLLGH